MLTDTPTKRRLWRSSVHYRLLAMYHARGYTDAQIAKKMGFTHSTIIHKRRDMDLPPNKIRMEVVG